MSFEQTCDDCGKEYTAAGNYCPFCGEPVDGDSSTIERRVTISEAPDGGLLVGEREIVDRVDGICSELEALRDEIDDPRAKAALRSAIGSAWRASVLHRVAKNSDIRMADTGCGSTSVRGPETDSFTRERGEDDRAQSDPRTIGLLALLLGLVLTSLIAVGVMLP